MKLKIETKTPLHIGSGKSLNPLEFVIFNGKVYVISEEKFIRFLKEKNLINDFMNFIRKKPQDKKSINLKEYLNKKGLLGERNLDKIYTYTNKVNFPLIKITRGDKRQKRITEIRTFMRDGNNRVYIPGSSLKGAIRNAFLWNILDKNGELKNKFINSVKESILKYEKEYIKLKNKILEGRELKDFLRNKRKEKRRKLDKEVKKLKGNFLKEIFSPDEEILQKFILDSVKIGPHTDLFRCLKIGDSNQLDKNSCELTEIDIFSFGGKKDGIYPQSSRKVGIKVYIETIPAGISFELPLSFDLNLWKEFKKQNRNHWFFEIYKIPDDSEEKVINFILNEVKKFYKELKNEEKRLFENMQNLNYSIPPDADFRFGWGGGLLSTSLSLLLPEDLRKRILLYFFRQIRVERKRAPNSRRLISDKPPGWCKLNLEV